MDTKSSVYTPLWICPCLGWCAHKVDLYIYGSSRFQVGNLNRECHLDACGSQVPPIHTNQPMSYAMCIFAYTLLFHLKFLIRNYFYGSCIILIVCSIFMTLILIIFHVIDYICETNFSYILYVTKMSFKKMQIVGPMLHCFFIFSIFAKYYDD